MRTIRFIFIAFLCAVAQGVWAQTSVSSDSELRSAIQNDGANIIVTADINLSNSTLSIESGKTVTIDLGGHTLDRKLTKRGEGGGQVITVRSGGTLNLSNGTLKGGYGGSGGGLANEGATVTLTNVTISSNVADDRGGGIVNKSGTLTMKGGSITGNISNDKTTPEGGGGIFNAEGATMFLEGVSITSNQAKVKGGGGICNYGTLTLDGCTVTGNVCKMNGGGIWQGASATLNMQGAMTVTDNTTSGSVTNNLFLKTNALITVTGSLTGSNVGIKMEASTGTFTSGYNTYNNGVDPATIFRPEIPEVMAVTLDGGEAKLGNSLPEGDVYYIDVYEINNKKIGRQVKILHSGQYTLLEGSHEDKDLFIEGGTYVVKGNCFYDGMAYISGDTKIILCDGAKLEIEGSIRLTTTNIQLDVYGQAQNNGVLQNNANINHTTDYTPGIGSDHDTRVLMNFHGGTIKAQGERSRAGISGGMAGDMSQINFYDAIVEARGGTYGPGIGTWIAANYLKNMQVCIFGGIVKAWGGDEAAGIGGGDEGYGVSVYVYGGEVYAYGGDDGAGIGSGHGSDGRTLEVYGGIVKAWGGGNGAGIGSGSQKIYTDSSNGGYVLVHGGEVYAYGGVDAAGIGGGEDSRAGGFEISGGYVYAEGNGGGAGIGGGQDGDGGNITITGGTVIAKAGANAPGAIGGGEDGEHGSLTLGDDRCVYITNNLWRCKKENRISDCLGAAYLQISKCLHGGATATVVSGEKHSISNCQWCYTGEEAHTFGDDSQCAACKLIRLEDEGDNSALFTKWSDGDAHDFLLSGRKLVLHEDGSARAYTVCLPFDMDLTEHGDDLMLYTLSYIKDGKEMVFTQAGKKVEAGKPYLIVIHQGELELLGHSKLTTTASEGVRVYDWTNREQPLGWWRGTLTKIESADAAEMMAYALQSVGDFRRIRPDTPYAWWGAFRSMYCPDELPATNKFTINRGAFSGLGGQTVTVTFEGDAEIEEGTGIRSIDNGQLIMDNSWYNLSGQRLSKPQKGINIINGKKVLY